VKWVKILWNQTLTIFAELFLKVDFTEFSKGGFLLNEVSTHFSRVWLRNASPFGPFLTSYERWI